MANASNVWHIDKQVYEAAKVQLSDGSMYSKSKKAPYIIIEAGEIDKKRVMDLYQRCKVPGYEVSKVEVIFNKTLVQGFEYKIQALEQRYENTAFDPKWKIETKDPHQKRMRERVDYKLAGEVAKYTVANRHVKLLPMFHGTNPKLFDSIFRTGFDNLATTDAGYFGKGLYNTSYAEYAWRVYSTGALIFNWVAFYSAFPVIKEDMKQLIGSARVGNYDAHYALVRPMNPQNPKEKVYLPIGPSDKEIYDELVVFESAQVLPRYVVTLGPVGLKLKEIAPKQNKENLLAAMAVLWKKAQPSLQAQLKKKMEEMEKDVSQELTKEEEWLQDHIDQINANEKNQDQDIPKILNEQMESMLKTASQFSKIAPASPLQVSPLSELEEKESPELLYQKGQKLLVAKKGQESFITFKIAADQGHAPAQFQVSMCYKLGSGVPLDYQAAITYAQKAADQDHPEACDYIGHCYHHGYTLPKDPKKAFVWFKKAAEKENPSSMLYMAIYYRDGLGGCPIDSKESFRWWKMAADAGNALAQWEVSKLAKIDKNFSEAFAYGLKAADNGITEAEDYIGHCYCKGLSTTQDIPKAIKYFIKAARKGNQSAIQYLQGCASQGYEEAQIALQDLKPGVIS